MILYDPKNREEWLRCRCMGIGGSDAGAVLGLNKYKTNVQLWEEKTGKYRPDDISEKPAVKYGKDAESHLRSMFALDFPEYRVDYNEIRMYGCDERPFMYATLDGELTDHNGRKGILEIKTATIQNASQWRDWENQIPDCYYAQLVHQLACTGWDFAILKAHIRHYSRCESTTRHYHVERSSVLDDIAYLINAESQFWECVQQKKKPNLILPTI